MFIFVGVYLWEFDGERWCQRRHPAGSATDVELRWDDGKVPMSDARELKARIVIIWKRIYCNQQNVSLPPSISQTLSSSIWPSWQWRPLGQCSPSQRSSNGSTTVTVSWTLRLNSMPTADHQKCWMTIMKLPLTPPPTPPPPSPHLYPRVSMWELYIVLCV